MPFLSAYVPVLIEPDGRYRLTAQMVYRGRDDTFTVPAGFQTDLASIPRYMTWLVPVAGVQDRAAIVHDWLCGSLAFAYSHNKASGSTVARAVPVASAVDTDGIFRRILRELGVGAVRRWLMWTGVRWGALLNPARRAGWLRTAPAVVGISVVALPLLLPATVAVLATLAVDTAVEAVVGRWCK